MHKLRWLSLVKISQISCGKFHNLTKLKSIHLINYHWAITIYYFFLEKLKLELFVTDYYGYGGYNGYADYYGAGYGGAGFNYYGNGWGGYGGGAQQGGGGKMRGSVTRGAKRGGAPY